MQLCELSYKFKVKMVPEFLAIAMTIKVAEGVALQLDPDLELSKVAIPVSLSFFLFVVSISVAFLTIIL